MLINLKEYFDYHSNFLNHKQEINPSIQGNY